MVELSAGEVLQNVLISRAGWVCPTCVVRSISVRGNENGLSVEIVHSRHCIEAARWVMEQCPSLDNPNEFTGPDPINPDPHPDPDTDESTHPDQGERS